MKISFEGTTTQVITEMKAAVYVLERGNQSGVHSSTDETMTEIKKKRTRPAAKEEPAVEEMDETEESEDEDFGEEEEAEEAETLSAEQIEKLKGALKAYSVKHTKEAAIKVLHKFAKKSTDVKPADLAKLLKLLKA